MTERERWATRIGLVLAMAGNAVGLGNFLRFPVQAAKNGGGAFMIPYFVSFLLLGIPLMWMEWTMGRLGGKHGHGTTPGMFDVMTRGNRLARYLGVFGVVGPLLIVIYYIYIESWTLGFSIVGLFGGLPKLGVVPMGPEGLKQALQPFRDFLFHYKEGVSSGYLLHPSLLAYFFFTLTVLINVWVIARGVSRGIEMVAKIAMPTLFIFAVILVIRVFTLGSPVDPTLTPVKGLAFLWEPQLDKLGDWKIWLAAAGQIFFTLSLGMGSIQTYASYLREKDDVVATGLATASTNEFAEVVLGGSIAIPAAVVFFGVTAAQAIAAGGAFDLGFVSMPAIFSKIPLGGFFAFLWFGLLFFAGITSSLALTQPAMAFLQDELKFSRKKAALTVGIFIFLAAQLPIFFRGALDELDFWISTVGITLFAFIESVLFTWVFGMDKAWEEIHKGADMRLPTIFRFIMKYITPLMLGAILLGWLFTEWLPVMKTADPVKWATRAFIAALLGVGLYLIYLAWKLKAKEA